MVLVNNDEQDAFLSVPLPTGAQHIENLETKELVQQENGRVNLTLPAGGSALLLLRN
jgi:hypothetical protein